jgi:hypothetical protein
MKDVRPVVDESDQQSYLHDDDDDDHHHHHHHHHEKSTNDTKTNITQSWNLSTLPHIQVDINLSEISSWASSVLPLLFWNTSKDKILSVFD